MSKAMYDSLDSYNKGDWVRFYRNGTLVIGQIEYLYSETGGHKFAGTDAGPVNLDSVLELREMVV